MKRIFDLTLSTSLLLILFVPILVIGMFVILTSTGPALYWSERIGINNESFKMPKFRSMKAGTPVTASHLLNNPNSYLSPIGAFLRGSSLDELPQLLSVLIGNMSFVGPRPALHSQHDLIALRVQSGVDALLPGITGWAQINGRDDLSVPAKVLLDTEYLNRQSFWFDMKILSLTLWKVLKRSGVSH